MIYTILIALHLIVSILLVVVILLQSSKGGGLAGSAFGGGGGGSSFLGARGTASFLTRATTVLAIVFMLNSLGLSFMLQGGNSAVSVTQQEIQSAAENLPRLPGSVDMSGMESAPIQTLPADKAGDQGSEQPVESDDSAKEQ
ncbi:preprotein translocase subunit SecG [bacterium]|nr:preprotein translocase subunit SecG [bacterium]MBU1653085.1 preprotein translocase subunit SecG [bacterium]